MWTAKFLIGDFFSWQSCDKLLLGPALARPGSLQVQDVSVIQHPRLNLKNVVIDLGMNNLARPYRKKIRGSIDLDRTSRLDLGLVPFLAPR